MKKRQNVPTIPCPGCKRPMKPNEHEHAHEVGVDAVISWTCANLDCDCYGPRFLRPGERLEF